jgi:putative aldouronate transport system substrate-binding protein
MSNGNLSRRRVLGLGLGLGLGVAAGGALAACSEDEGPSAGGGGNKLKLPNYMPPQSLPGATISQVEGVGPAYEAYPNPPVKSVASAPITSGKPVTTFQILFPAPPPALDRNEYWQQLNERLGGEFKPTLAPFQSYGEKLQTTIASGNMPDLTFIEPGQNAQAVVRTLKEGAFTDLTEVLAGDGIKDYPNLAQVPTHAWKNAAIEGKIYGVPRPISLLIADAGFAYRQDWAERAGFGSAQPKNADELLEFFKGMSGNGRWAIGALYQRWYYMMFKVPNNWRLNSDGTLTNFVESDELEQALTFLNTMWKAGVFHPDAPTKQWSGEAVELFFSDKVGAIGGGMIAHYGKGGDTGNFLASHPNVKIGHLLPMGHDGAAPTIHQRQGIFGIYAIPATVGKDEERLKELLRVLNYTGAAFGTEEFLFMEFGIEGRHYTKDSAGNPVLVDQGPILDERNLNFLNQPVEAVTYFPGVPGDSVSAQKQLEAAAASWIPDPTWGLVSDTNNRKAAALRQIEDDFQFGIITGRRPMTDLAKWRDEWKRGGGEDIRKELEESLQRSQG